MDDRNEQTPIEKRTPKTEAERVICALADIWERWKPDQRVDFRNQVFKEIWDDESATGKAKIEELFKTEEQTDWTCELYAPLLKAAIVQTSAGLVACAFAIQALKAEEGSDRGWFFVCQARHWLGRLQGIIRGRGMEHEGPSKFALSGARAKNRENNRMKDDVFAWCDANFANYKSMDSAASAIAGKLVPVTFRTVRSWIGEWKKMKLRAGTL